MLILWCRVTIPSVLIYKLLRTLTFKKVLQPVIQSISNDWLDPLKSDWEVTTMKNQAYRGRLITMTDYCIMTLCYMGFIILPLFGFNVRIITNLTDVGNRHLLVQSRLPYDYTSSPQYELTHTAQLLGSFFVGMSVCIPDDYFCTLVLHTSGQYEILGRKIENFVTEEENRGFEMKIMKRNLHRKIRSFINRHVHLNE